MNKKSLLDIMPIIVMYVLLCSFCLLLIILMVVGREKPAETKIVESETAQDCESIRNQLSGDKHIYLFDGYDVGIILNKPNPNAKNCRALYYIATGDVYIYTNIDCLTSDDTIDKILGMDLLFFPDVAYEDPFLCGNAGKAGEPRWSLSEEVVIPSCVGDLNVVFDGLAPAVYPRHSSSEL